MKILHPSRIRTALHAVQLLHLGFSRPFSSTKTSTPFRTNRIHKALKILQLVTPKSNLSTNNPQTHLRLIQDFLQTGSEQQPGNVSSTSAPSDTLAHPKTREMFDKMPDPDVFETKESLFDAVVLSQRISSCGHDRNLLGGVQYHSVAITTGYLANVYVGSSLITMYCKCGEIEDAEKVVVEMSVKNVVSWTAIIAGFSHDWRIDKCLKLYHMMRDSGTKPNDYTFTGLLSACMGTGALGQGTSVHCQVILMGFESYIHVVNSLVSMYCKCGKVDDSLHLFRNNPSKDVVSWNSMIAGYAQYGLALQAIDLFEEMKMQKVKPDAITFLGILSSCRHAGLVDEGRKYFDLMFGYGLVPELDHYSCIVDLLGRGGKLREARDFIKKMPIQPNAVIWGSLLSSCRLHASVWIGIEAAESRLELEPGCAATHVQLANLYASVGYWQQAARVRKLMKDKGLRTSPGYSWIEISNEVHKFKAEDRLNTQVAQVIDVLDHLMDHMRNFRYVPEVYVEEDNEICQVTPLVI